MSLLDFPAEIRRWITVGILIAVLCLVMAVFTTCKGRDAAIDRARTSDTTAGALDRVTMQTDEIRTEQEDKQNAVDEIQGSDDRLPDGYGRRLECVRRGVKCGDPG